MGGDEQRGVRPRARKAGIVVRRVGVEIVVYDLDRHRAHCLNVGAAAVFESCDGRTGLPSLARGVRRRLGARVDEDWVRAALDALRDAHLLEDARERPADIWRKGRREALRFGAGAALLLPAIVSVVAPTPAEAAATCIPYQACTDDNIGQPCYTGSATECTTSPKTCQGVGVCVP